MTTKPHSLWPGGAGTMPTLMRGHDWAMTPLGRPAAWPAELRAAVEDMLSSPQPGFIGWGPQAILLYNDHHLAFLGHRHPGALGQSYRQTWPETWAQIGPRIDSVLQGQPQTFADEPLVQDGRLAGWFTSVWTPIRRAADGQVAGFRCTATDTTAQVRDRRARFAGHRAVLDSVEQGFCVVQLLLDATGQPFDAHFVEVNPAFVAQSGLDGAVGRRLRDLVPSAQQGCIHFIGRVALTGRAERFTRKSDALGRWFDVQVLPYGEPGTHHVAVLFSDITQARTSEQALGASEAKYKALFNALHSGFALMDLVLDAEGRPVDLRYVETNPAFAREAGRAPLPGQLHSQAFPGPPPRTLELLAQVARTGQAHHLGETQDQQGRWYDAHVLPVESDDGLRVAGLFTNITARKVAELRLRDSEDRQAFLLKLSDAVRNLDDPDSITAAAARALADALRATRCYYVEWLPGADYGQVRQDFAGRDLPSLVGRYPNATFQTTYDRISTGRTWVVPDVCQDHDLAEPEVAAFLSLGVRAWIDVPLVKRGQLSAALCVVCDGPRDWTDQDIRLAEDVAERVWAAIQRSRAEGALRASESRLRQFGDASQDILWIRDAATLQLTYLTPAFETICGLDRQTALQGDTFQTWTDLVLPEDRPRLLNSIQSLRNGEPVATEFRIRRPSDGAIRWLRNTDFPIRDAHGRVVMLGGIGHDVTELQETSARLTALIEGIPQLVWRASAPGKWTWASPQWTAFTGQDPLLSQGWGWLDALHPQDRDLARAAWHDAPGRDLYSAEYRIRSARTGALRWFKTRAVPVRDQAGGVVEWLGTSTDIHDLRELQSRQELLVIELQHRTRNLLSVVIGLANRSLRESHSLQDFAGRFSGRLGTLSRVQGFLSDLQSEGSMTIDQMVTSELQALGAPPERLSLAGPGGIVLPPDMVQTLALAIHELGTNALKYGVLRQDLPSGTPARLAVTWHVTAPQAGRRLMTLTWRETGISADPPPPSAGIGFGRYLIEQAIPQQMEAETRFRLTAEGVHCTLDIVLTDPPPRA